MECILQEPGHVAINERIAKLRPDTQPQWGKMSKADWSKFQRPHFEHHLTQFGV